MRGRSLAVLVILLVFTASCGNRMQEQFNQRMSEVLDIYGEVGRLEAGFLSALDDMNLRRGDSAFTAPDLELTSQALRLSYDTYLAELDMKLGEAALLADRETCPSVSALSEYILAMKELAEVRYSEMLRLSSLPFGEYSAIEQEAYHNLVKAAGSQRTMIDRLFRESMMKFAGENGVELQEFPA